MPNERKRCMLPGKIVKSSRGYEYAEEKIDKQQIRVQTLELVLMEHKKLFASKGLLQDDFGWL